MFRNLVIAGASAGVLSCAPASLAGVLLEESFSGSVVMQLTDWEETLSVQQFDDMGGARQLVSIDIHLEGAVSGSASLESLDAAPTTVLVELSAQIMLSLNDAILGVVLPIADESFDASTYDGLSDFGGTSGTSFDNLFASDSSDIVLTDADTAFAAFIGAGTIDLTGVADGTSFGAGAGNLMLMFNASAEMAFRVTYNFTEIPAPGSLAILAGAGLAAGRRRRR